MPAGCIAGKEVCIVLQHATLQPHPLVWPQVIVLQAHRCSSMFAVACVEQHAVRKNIRRMRWCCMLIT